MTFEYLIKPEQGPQWRGVLPGRPEPYVLHKGEGEHAMLFGDLFTVLLSGDETDGQFGVITSDETHETFYILDGMVRLFFTDAGGTKTSRLLTPGDFAYVPAGTPHAYRVEEAARIMGTMTGGFERFFQHMGTVTDHNTKDQPPFIPDFGRMKAAAQEHRMELMPDFDWPDS